MNLGKLYKKNKFVKSIQLGSHDILDKGLPEHIKKLQNSESQSKYSKLSKKEKYILEVFKVYSNIMDKLDVLENIKLLIRTYPHNKTYRKKITNNNHIRYHIEAYYLNLIGVFDRLMHLTNLIHDLGIDDKKVTYQIITTNKHLEKTKLKELLNNLFSKLKKQREVRNLITHYESYEDPELNNVRLYEEIILMPSKLGMKVAKSKKHFYNITKIIFDNYKKEYISNTCKIFDKINKEVFTSINLIFNEIDKVYRLNNNCSI